MNNEKNISDELIFKILNRKTSDHEEKIFRDWLGASPRNQKTFRKIETLWKNETGLDTWYRIDSERAWNVINRRISQQSGTKLWKPLARIAAAVAMAFLLGGLAGYFMRAQQRQTIDVSETTTVKAPLGSKTEVELPDGTKVWLNAGSEINYTHASEKKKREVFLTGEAYFDVSRNPGLPFFVNTEELTIRVLGTRFNVKSYPDEAFTETILEEGRVRIGEHGSKETTEMKPLEMVTYSKNSGGQPEAGKARFILTKHIDTTVYTSWKNGKLIFKRERIDDLAVKLERWYNVKISIANNRLAEEKVTGVFENETIEQALEALKLSIPFTCEIRKNNIIIR